MLKKTIALLICLLLLLASPALAFIEPSGAFYVTDQAGVLSKTTEERIVAQNELLREATGAEIAVVTMRYLDEEDYHTDEYAVQLMNDWGVGDGEKDNSLLLLLVTEEGKAWLTQGAGQKDAMTNEQAATLLDRWFWTKFDDGKYDEAVSDLFTALIRWYEQYYGFTLGSGASAGTEGEREEGGVPGILILVLIIVVGISLLRSGLFRSFAPRARTWGFGPGSGYSRGYRGGWSSGGSSYRSSGSYRSGGGSFRSGGGRPGGGGRSGGGGAGRR